MEFRAATPEEFDSLFATYKQGIFEHVEATFGWDENFQVERFKCEYSLNWFHWILVDSNKVGLICFKQGNGAKHIHLLVVFPEFRRQGYGQIAMQKIHELMKSSQNGKVKLSSFKINIKAIKFYKQLGYVVDGEDEHFVSMTLHPAL